MLYKMMTYIYIWRFKEKSEKSPIFSQNPSKAQQEKKSFQLIIMFILYCDFFLVHSHAA